jgi:poly(3-hydroxybutyrate) depolymerase
MRSVFRVVAVLVTVAFAFTCATAKDVDAKYAKRRLDAVFSKSDSKDRDKIIRKLDGFTLDAAGGAEARAHALQLQRATPRKLPKLEEAFQGALDYQYAVRTRKTTYKTFALLDLPRGLSKDKPAPLLIGLHSDLGTGWREMQALRTCSRFAPELKNCIIACPNALNRGSTSEDPRKNPPGAHEYFGWGPKREGIDSVFILLDKLLAEYNIDRDRIYLEGGPGMGSEAVFHLAMLRPSQFAAICVRDSLPPHYYTELERDADLKALRKAGTLGEQKVEFPWVECYRNTPVFWVHGDDDRKTPTTHAHLARDAMKAVGVPLKYFEYKGSHASGSTPTIAKALQACVKVKRNPLPVSITARGVRDDKASLGNDRNYWVEITKQSFQGKKGDWPYKIFAGGKVTVTADKGTNTLTITTDDVKEIRVYLTDDLLYLDREIKLVVNGKERTTNATRELKVLAETASNFAPSGEAYTAVLNINT